MLSMPTRPKSCRLASATKALPGPTIFRTAGMRCVPMASTIPAVDKIVGPGNAFVAEAKRQVLRAGSASTASPARARC